MSDALLSVAVGGTMTAVSSGAIGYSIRKIQRVELDDKKIPMMGVMGAFVFAAQMINFTIPGTGSSGHIGGGILLAALLGPYPAFITLTSVLLIQCLFFADGGLLALGSNIFNMGVIPCLITYPLLYRTLLIKEITPKRITIASILSVVVGLQLGAFSVVLETVFSGITVLPFLQFVTLMLPIHLAIGIVEGIVTAAVLCFIYGIRKELLEGVITKTSLGNVSVKKVLVILLIASALTGGILSLYASSNPDGLEWSIEGVTGTTEIKTDSDAHAAINSIQEKTALLPDYSFNGNNKEEDAAGISISGIVGGIFTLIITVFAGFAILIFKKIKQNRNVLN
jgi:cobalt/nickel transport system permease protein